MSTLWLGCETDDALLDRLRAAVHSLDGTFSDPAWAIAGSQEITTYTIDLPSGSLIMTSETYSGITLHGPEALVLALAQRVNV